MRTVAVALVCALAAGVAGARESDACISTAGPTAPDFALRHVAQALVRKALDVVVIGSASSELKGPAGTDVAYPTGLEKALTAMLPGVAVKVSTFTKSRDSAADMVAKLKRIMVDAKPALVVWQTGTADAIRGIDPDEFRSAMDEGVAALQKAGTDVVLMNLQYSPRTESMISSSPYLDNMRVVAQQYSVPLFDRFAIMRQWNDSGEFDFFASHGLNLAKQVHDCLGHALAKFVIDAAHLDAAQQN